MQRTSAYLRFVDPDRMLHMFRVTAGLPSAVQPLGGWEAPNVQLRGHSMGHLLSGLALSAGNTGDPVLVEKSRYLVKELAACQEAAAANGATPGYLSAFGEQTFVDLENGKVPWAPYYTIHKIMAGLLDQHVLLGDPLALEVVVAQAGWVDTRTSGLTRAEMQKMLNVEFGGMNEMLVNLWKVTHDPRHLELAQRFDHDAVFVPLAARTNTLAGRHANTEIPKVVGAAEEYLATGDARYNTIATYFWSEVVHRHTYVIGGNSNAEFFGEPGQIVSNLGENTCENCNTYNMIKLSRALSLQQPDTTEYMDYIEWALLNQMLGEQDPDSTHGNVTYYTGLSHTASRKGKEGLKSDPGSYSSDYDNFSCDHGSGMETHSKFADSVWFTGDATAYLNLFIPSTFRWDDQAVDLEVTTEYPYEDRIAVTVRGSGTFELKIRIPSWVERSHRKPRLTLNGRQLPGRLRGGTYTSVHRTWTDGDRLEVELPMEVSWLAAQDNPAAQALTYGPLVYAARLGSTTPGSLPMVDPSTLRRTDAGPDFTAEVEGREITFSPFLDVHHEHYNVYFLVRPAKKAPELVAQFTFDETGDSPAHDSTGRWPAAALVAGAQRTPRGSGSGVQLDGAKAHVVLPAGLLAGLEELSVSVWARVDRLVNNSRVFDLGHNANTYLFLNPRTGSNRARMGLKLAGMDGEDFVDGNGPLPEGRWMHIAATLGAGAARLYLDGELFGSNESLRLSPLALGATQHNYLGRSQNVKHPYFPGAVDDFRLYGRALTADDVKALHAAGT